MEHRERRRAACRTRWAWLVTLAVGGCAHRGEWFICLNRASPAADLPVAVPVVQEGHAAPVSAIAVDPTGELVVTAAGAELRLWEVRGGRLRARVDGFAGEIRDVAFTWGDVLAWGEVEAPGVAFVDDDGLKSWSLVIDTVRTIAPDVTRVVAGNAGVFAAALPTGLLFGEHYWNHYHRRTTRNLDGLPTLSSLVNVSGAPLALDVVRWEPCPALRCGRVRRAAAVDDRGSFFIVESFAAGRMLPGSTELGAPDLRAAFVLHDGSLSLDFAQLEHQGATVCVTVVFVDGRPDSTTCFRSERRPPWTVPADEIAEMFVQVCDATRTVCGRRMRVDERLEPAMRRGR